MKRTLPNFILGKQKMGATRLLSILDQHRVASLPQENKIHYVGSSELFASEL
jgi:hypothetical protein